MITKIVRWTAVAACWWCCPSAGASIVMDLSDPDCLLTAVDVPNGGSQGAGAHAPAPLLNEVEEVLAAAVSADVAAPTEFALGGDFNGSGFVDQLDLDLVLAHWGGDLTALPDTWVNERPADRVDQSALDSVLLNWGKTAFTASAEPATPVGVSTSAVPEPGGAAVGLLLLASVACGRVAYTGIERMRSPVA